MSQVESDVQVGSDVVVGAVVVVVGAAVVVVGAAVSEPPPQPEVINTTTKRTLSRVIASV
jgi:hypothetical protein